MTTPTQYQVIHQPAQNAIGGTHLHTPQSIFQHMMGQQNVPHQSGPWPQMPKVPPMMMPWSIPSLQQSQLVRFTGERLQPTDTKPLHVKRKLEVPDSTSDLHKAKQFITEEKMAAHFQDMHISSNYEQNPLPSTSSAGCDPQPSCSSAGDDTCLDLDMDEAKNVHPRLIISEELKRIQHEPLLPDAILSKLERPSMALVLWEPPSKHLRMLSTRETLNRISSITNETGSNNASNEPDDDRASGNNNDDDIADMNPLPMEEQNIVELEPMDL